MNCQICGECILRGSLVEWQLPSGILIGVCDTCAATIPGEAMEPAQVPEEASCGR